MRILTGLIIVALTASLLVSAQEARAAGVYVDASGDAGFLVSTHRPSAHGTVILTDRAELDASMYVVSLYFTPHSNLLINVEQAYISTSHKSALESGFGDLRLALRTNIVHREGRALRLLASLRTGNGNADLFPYSSETLDLELALGYVDSLEFAHVWARAGVASVNRESQDIPVAIRHDDYLRADAGVAVPMGSEFSLRGGTAVMTFRAGPTRQIYFAGLGYNYSSALRLHADLHIEGGSVDARVSDGAISVGVDVNF